MFEGINPLLLTGAACCLGPAVLFGSGWLAHAWALRIRRRYRIVDVSKLKTNGRPDVGYGR